MKLPRSAPEAYLPFSTSGKAWECTAYSFFYAILISHQIYQVFYFCMQQQNPYSANTADYNFQESWSKLKNIPSSSKKKD